MSRHGGPGSHRRWRIRGILAAVVVASVGTGLGVPRASAQSDAVYSLAGGCYSLTASTGQAVPGASQLRLQATDLGSYLLYRTDQQFLAASGSSVAPAPQPSPAADWVVDDAPDSSFTLSPKSAPNQAMALSGGNLALGPRDGSAATRFRFASAGSCAVYPEAELNASGTPSRGATPYGQVR